MATLSESDYKELAPFIPVLKMYKEHDINVGCDIHAFKKIYDRVANDSLNTGCGGCIDNAYRRAYDLIEEYQKQAK